MSLKSRLISFSQNDHTIYQLLLIGLIIASPAFHYLCFYNSFDPLWLRAINSAFCLPALLLSFYYLKFLSPASRYLAILSCLVINNGILLSGNGFAQIYLFSSLMLFVALTLLCKKTMGIFCTVCS